MSVSLLFWDNRQHDTVVAGLDFSHQISGLHSEHLLHPKASAQIVAVRFVGRQHHHAGWLRILVAAVCSAHR